MEKGKAFIFSAPSGSGKTTIVKHLLDKFSFLGFSISATTRKQRPGEVDGKHYHFLSEEEFRQKIEQNAFIEWEQVFEGMYYGTMVEEGEKLWRSGKHVLFDVDVVGGLNLKKYFGEDGLAVFVKVPGIKELEKRLKDRKTESKEAMVKRLDKFEFELRFEDQFDVTLINDQLDHTFAMAEQLVTNFINTRS